MKITIYKDVKKFALTTDAKKSEYDLVKKYRPDALKVFEGEDKDLKFVVGYTEGKPCVSANCLTFGQTNDQGCMMLTADLPEKFAEGETPAGYVADKVGGVMKLYAEIEKSIPTVAAEVKAERDALIGTMVQA